MRKTKRKPMPRQVAPVVPPLERDDILDKFAKQPLERVLELVFWKLRHKQPDMAVLIEEKDIVGFDQCMAYQSIIPAIMVHRPKGRPANPGSPAIGKRRAVPATPAEPDRPFVIVALVEKGKQNTIKPVENNEDDYKRGELVRAQAVARGRCQTLAQALRNGTVNMDLVTSGMLEEAAQTLITLGATI